MNDSMKKPPMQKDAERLAAQGRFGDSMLVHMTPAEVQGIASLVPGGRLTTNPETGQPEAFIMEALAAITAAKGAYDAFKKPKGTGQTAARRQGQSAIDQYTQNVLRDVGQSQAYQVPKTLNELAASGNLNQATSFLPSGVSGFNLGYQRLPGMTYANLPGTTQPFYSQPTAPAVPTAPIQSTQPADDASQTDSRFDALPEESQAIISSIREDLGLPSFGSYEDLVPKPVPKKATGNVGKQRKIARENKEALERWNKGKAEFEARLKGGSETQPAPQPEIQPEIGISFPSTFGDDLMLAAQGGIANLAQGGDIDFPRMNGPIAGPGTETSDDIPAMLSDGEFVVNAKAVRGVGRMNGAGKSKEEQRREGARMMYALQKAGEQAMRKT
jgi:hypothetical protein